MVMDVVPPHMSSEGTYVPGIVRWLIVVVIFGLVLLAAFWRPEAVIDRPGPLGVLDERTWVEGVAYGALTLSLLYAVSPASRAGTVSPLLVPVFVISVACLIESGQSLSGVAAFQAIDLVAASLSSIVMAVVWDAGRRAVQLPPA